MSPCNNGEIRLFSDQMLQYEYFGLGLKYGYFSPVILHIILNVQIS